MLENAVAPMADNVRGLFAAPPSQKEFNVRGGAKFSLPSLKASKPPLKALNPPLKALNQASVASSAQALTGVMKDDSNMSLDYLVELVAEYIDKLNTTSRHIAEKAGIIRFEKAFPVIPIPTPFAGIPLQVPSRMLVLVLQGVLEFVRISFAFSESRAGVLARIFSSIGAALIDAGKGDWKSALFTIIGVLNGQMVVIGAVGKMMVKILSFISDDISSQLGWAAYDSAKSWMAGIWIFVFSVFAPGPMRGLVESHLEELNGIIDTINQEVRYSIASLIGISSVFVNFAIGRIAKAIFAGKGIGEVLSAAVTAPVAAVAAAPAEVNPFRGGMRGGFAGCTVPGFESIESLYAPQGLVLPAAIFMYLLMDFGIHRGPSKNIGLGVLLPGILVAHSFVMYGLGCFNKYYWQSPLGICWGICNYIYYM
jgi:hypothetical protein